MLAIKIGEIKIKNVHFSEAYLEIIIDTFKKNKHLCLVLESDNDKFTKLAIINKLDNNMNKDEFYTKY